MLQVEGEAAATPDVSVPVDETQPECAVSGERFEEVWHEATQVRACIPLRPHVLLLRRPGCCRLDLALRHIVAVCYRMELEPRVYPSYHEYGAGNVTRVMAGLRVMVSRTACIRLQFC